MTEQFSLQDRQFMQRALELAEQGIFTTTPNPAVGCVLVKDGHIVGQGFHHKAGEPHAEVMALRDAGEQARGATAYVTLEPCAHYGRTPPCAKGLLEAGVSKVIAAMLDPNPQVAGKGLSILREGGIKCAVGLLEAEAEWLNRGFLKRMRTGRPYVQLKLAASLDGRTAMANGESKWITGVASRADVQIERAKASAILSTSATVIADNPSLNVRWSELPANIQAIYPQENLRQPIRIILDSHSKVRSDFQIFSTNSPVWLVGRESFVERNLPAQVEYLSVLETAQQTQLSALLDELGRRQINTLWVEAGANLAGSLLAQNLVDELIVYIAPKLLGESARPLCYLPNLQQLSDAPTFKLVHIKPIGDDVKLVYQKNFRKTDRA